MTLFLKNLLFTLLVPATVGGYLPWWIASHLPAYAHRLDSWTWTHTLALVPMTIGIAIYLWCLWDFATFGRGTPAPIDAPKKLVVRGLYRVCRNPMYVGVLSVTVGWAVLFRSWALLLYAAGAGLMFHLFIVFYEEPTLLRLFGDEFEAYTHRVGRWLPRFH